MSILGRIRQLLSRTPLAPTDPAVLQALVDQRTADYPYCPEGAMACRSLCSCVPGGPTSEFVTARAQLIREGRGDHQPVAGNIALGGGIHPGGAI